MEVGTTLLTSSWSESRPDRDFHCESCVPRAVLRWEASLVGAGVLWSWSFLSCGGLVASLCLFVCLLLRTDRCLLSISANCVPLPSQPPC